MNDLSDTILVGDDYYLHTDNETFNELQDIGGYYCGFATCTAKSSTEITFKCSYQPVTPPSVLDIDIANLVLDHISDGRSINPAITIADKEISFTIYTFIEPVFSHETVLNEGNEEPTGIQENQTAIERDIAEFKVWLKEEDKYLAEYLSHAVHYDILIDLKNYDNIIPAQVKDIITPVPNRNLIDLFEYDIKVIYNVKAVNLNR